MPEHQAPNSAPDEQHTRKCECCGTLTTATAKEISEMIPTQFRAYCDWLEQVDAPGPIASMAGYLDMSTTLEKYRINLARRCIGYTYALLRKTAADRWIADSNKSSQEIADLVQVAAMRIPVTSDIRLYVKVKKLCERLDGIKRVTARKLVLDVVKHLRAEN